MNPRRIASVNRVHSEHLEEYKTLHASVWPEVLSRITESHIRNFSIFLRKLPDGDFYLFSYFEYTGHDYEADMAAIASDPMTKQWWAVCGPCQNPLPDRKPGEWWAEMEEIFHHE